MPLLRVGGKACEVLHCLWPQVLPTGVNDGFSHLVQQVFDGANAPRRHALLQFGIVETVTLLEVV